MSIPNYIRPQLTIKQLLDVTPGAELDRINATIIGPQYMLSRFGKETVPAYAFDTSIDEDTDTAGLQLPYQYVDSDGVTQDLPSGYVVDLASVTVDAVGVEALLASLTGTLGTDDTASLSAAGYDITLYTGAFAGASLLAAFDGRDTAVGDVVYIQLDDTDASMYRRTVAGISSDGTTITLNAPIPDGDVSELEFYYEYTGPMTLTDHYTVSASGVTIVDGASLDLGQDLEAPLTDTVGEVSIGFRAFVPAASTDTYVSINSTTDIESNFGTVDIDNDIAYALSRALVGSQGKRVYGLGLTANTSAGYTAALRKIEATDTTYALVALTTDMAIQAVVASHVEAMSTDVKKNFRRMYVGVDSPGEYSRALAKAFTAVTYNSKANSYVTITAGGLTAAKVVAGDLFRVSDVNYEIETVIDDDTLILAEVGPGASGTANIYAADTVASQTEFVTATARGFGSRRVACIWVEDGTRFMNGEYTVIPNMFLASEIAGIRSALAPQAGLTRTEVTTITDAPAMHSKYTPDELDSIAEDGVFIVTQDVESGAVFIRHQLTTKTDSGSLYYEDNVGTNVDDMSFGLKDILSGYIGKKNVTPATIAEINTAVRNKMQDYAESDVDFEYGSQIISYDNLTVEAHATLKDRVIVGVRAEVPLPLNNIDVYLQASVGLTI
jgi:hypothetical protein